MPRVEQYGDARVQSQVVRQPRADTSAGNAVFQANAQVAKGLSAVAQEGVNIMQRIDTTSAEEALVAFERDKNNLFFDPESGYFNSQGKNAFDNATTASQSLEDLKKQYGENLNENARLMFDKAADVHIQRGQLDITKHASKGLKAWEVATINAQVDTTIENAALYWNQPDQFRVQNAVGRQAVIDSAQLEGIGPEATADRLKTYDASFAKAAITAATFTSSADGKELLDKHGGMLNSNDRMKLESAIEKKMAAEKVQRDSQQAVATGQRLASDYDSRGDIVDQVNQIQDPELRKKTMAEAMRQFNLKRQIESEAQTASFEAAETHILEGGSAETYQMEDPEGWERLSAKQKQKINSGQAVETDWNVYSDLMLLPKEQMSKLNPADYYHQLAPAERNKLIGAVKSAQGTGSTSQKIDHQNGRTRAAQTTTALELMLGRKKSKWNDKRLQQAEAFYELLDGELAYREEQKGSALSSQEYTDMLSELTRQVTIERSAFGIGFLAPDAEQTVADIPQGQIQLLSGFLRDNNIPVTAENLIKAQRQASK